MTPGLTITLILLLGTLFVVAIWLVRWHGHLLGLRYAAAGAYAPLDVQCLRLTDLTRELAVFLTTKNTDSMGLLQPQLQDLLATRRIVLIELQDAFKRPTDSLVVDRAMSAVRKLEAEVTSLLEFISEGTVGTEAWPTSDTCWRNWNSSWESAVQRHRNAESRYWSSLESYQHARRGWPGKLLAFIHDRVF